MRLWLLTQGLKDLWNPCWICWLLYWDRSMGLSQVWLLEKERALFCVASRFRTCCVRAEANQRFQALVWLFGSSMFWPENHNFLRRGKQPTNISNQRIWSKVGPLIISAVVAMGLRMNFMTTHQYLLQVQWALHTCACVNHLERCKTSNLLCGGVEQACRAPLNKALCSVLRISLETSSDVPAKLWLPVVQGLFPMYFILQSSLVNGIWLSPEAVNRFILSFLSELHVCRNLSFGWCICISLFGSTYVHFSPTFRLSFQWKLRLTCSGEVDCCCT